MRWEGGTPLHPGTEAPVLGILEDLGLCISSSSCSSVLYHALRNISKCELCVG